MQTNLLLSNDKDNHILSIVTGTDNGLGTVVSQWDYTEFYNEAVKDGILDHVELVVVPSDPADPDAEGQVDGTYLKFTFNTASGKQPLYVNVTDLIDVYTGSTYINIEKNNGTAEVSIKTTELVNYLKTDEALGITSIISRIEGIEGDIEGLKTDIENLQKAWDELDIQKWIEQIETNTSNIDRIFEYLEDVPNTAITLEEIESLE
jgi:hypothetical protein